MDQESFDKPKVYCFFSQIGLRATLCSNGSMSEPLLIRLALTGGGVNKVRVSLLIVCLL